MVVVVDDGELHPHVFHYLPPRPHKIHLRVCPILLHIIYILIGSRSCNPARMLPYYYFRICHAHALALVFVIIFVILFSVAIATQP